MNQSIENTLLIKEITPSESMPEAHLFNSSCFLLNKPFSVRGWQLLKEQKPVAQIYFYIHNGIAISGYQSTFGSFDVSKNVTAAELSFFVKSLISKLRTAGAAKIKIKHYPAYFKQSNLVKAVLDEVGFLLTLTEINQHIVVKELFFEDVANRSEVIRSNKCEKSGYQFKIVSIDKLPEIYNLIRETLLRNGNSVSMSLHELKKVIEACPNNYILFSLWHGSKLIAATVSIKIYENVLYNFYHADSLEYRSSSAMTYLLKNIYLYCLNNNYKTLDLGISSINGVLNKGLFNFKKARGAVFSNKNFYNLQLT